MISAKNSLRRRFVLSFAGLLSALGALTAAVTVGSLVLHYRSSVDQRTLEVSRRFERAVFAAEEALVFRTRILADVARIEALGLEARLVREIQVYTLHWLKHDGLQVVGMGGREYWDGKRVPADLLRRAFAGIPTVEFHIPPGDPPTLLGATPREGPGGVTEVIVASLPLDHETLRSLALRAGGEIALYDKGGRLLSSSLAQAAPVDGGTALPAERNPSTLAVEGVPYATRNFPLSIGQREVGSYTVLWPVSEQRLLTMRLAAWLLSGAVVGMGLFYFLYRRLIASTTADIETLSAWAQRFSSRDPTAPPALARDDEVGVLGQSFSHLVVGLRDALDEVEVKNAALAEINLSLEGTVEEKTRELEDQRRILDTALSGMRPAVFLLGQDHRIAYLNAAAVRIFGDAVGESCDALWGFKDCPCPGQTTGETEVYRNGFTYLVSCTPLGRGGGSVLVAQDITERKALERQLLHSQKLESVGRLAGGVAHDFNNVLGSIAPCLGIIRRRSKDAKVAACADTIENAADRASAVVKQLLTFSRAGDFKPVPTDLNTAVEGAINLLRPGIRGVTLNWLPGEVLPLIQADETQVQQIILNLVLNSVDAMGGSGTVGLATRRVEERGAVLLSVEDTGPGIPAYLADKVFDPFFTTKEPGKGTGLGLSIVYGVVERHAGKIRVVPGNDGGARFEVEFPVIQPRDASAEDGHASGERILVVDDDALLLQSLADSLRDYGFEVLTAGSGEQALALLDSGEAAVRAAVLDVRMPRMNGVELAKRVRERVPQLPILFMTGFSDRRADELLSLSGRAPLTKPFTAAHLVETLRPLLQA